MLTKSKKLRKWQKIRDKSFQILLSLSVLLILSALIFSNWKINKKRTEFQTKIKFLEEEIQRLEKEKEKYNNYIMKKEKIQENIKKLYEMGGRK